jgi:hypothetical protein
MRSLILHANKFKVRVISKSNKPIWIISEEEGDEREIMKNNLTILFCIFYIFGRTDSKYEQTMFEKRMQTGAYSRCDNARRKY